ncbi:MAG: barA [Herbinix sp.]|jgi:signal transduction histidine kinase/DNA-binding response OmpR family regulator|nr:barA [Herbinix sp.]
MNTPKDDPFYQARLKEIEDELKQEKNNFKNYFVNNPLGLLIVNYEMVIQQANPALLSMIGHSLDEIIGYKIGEIFCCTNTTYLACGLNQECNRCLLKQSLYQVRETGIPYANLLFQGFFHSSEYKKNYWLNLNLIPIVEGGENKIMLTIEDITNQEETKRAKGEFLANISHEIRTPLNGIMGMLNLTLLSELSKEQQDNLNVALSCANALLMVINDILDFSKMEEGRLELHRSSFPLENLIEQTVKTYIPQVKEKNLEITYQISDQLPTCYVGDEKRIKQVLDNLLGNAVKFTHTGSIHLNIEEHDRVGDLLHIKFTVTDTGIGIAKDEMSLLFQSFRQVDGSMTRKYGGTGLGLTISKQLVELMGGWIWALSEKGKGSSFTFVLPLKVSELIKPMEDKLQLIAEPTGNPLHILLVEDDKICQYIFVQMLKEQGHYVIAVNNGLQALKIVEDQRFDLIFMDIQMPEMDGIEATKQLRNRNGWINNIPIIAVTAHASPGDREKALSMGMDDYLPKPVLMNELYQMIEKYSKVNQSINTLNDPEDNEKHKRGASENQSLQDQNIIIYQYIQILIQAVDRMDIKKIEDTVHTVKNIATKMEFDGLRKAAFHMELSARREDLTKIKIDLSKLIAEYDKLIQFIS